MAVALPDGLPPFTAAAAEVAAAATLNPQEALLS